MKFASLRRFSGRTFAVALVAGTAVSAHAAVTGPDLSALTAAVDFGTVTAAVLAISALYAVVLLAIKGAHLVLGQIKGK